MIRKWGLFPGHRADAETRREEKRGGLQRPDGEKQCVLRYRVGLNFGGTYTKIEFYPKSTGEALRV